MWILFENRLVNTEQLIEIEQLDDTLIIGKGIDDSPIVLYTGDNANGVFQTLQFNLQTRRSFFNIDNLSDNQ